MQLQKISYKLHRVLSYAIGCKCFPFSQTYLTPIDPIAMPSERINYKKHLFFFSFFLAMTLGKQFCFCFTAFPCDKKKTKKTFFYNYLNNQ